MINFQINQLNFTHIIVNKLKLTDINDIGAINDDYRLDTIIRLKTFICSSIKIQLSLIDGIPMRPY